MKFIKKFFIVMLSISLIMFSLSCFADAKENSSPQEEFFRLHIRANSDSEHDQNLKLKVRNAVLVYTSPLMENIHSKQEAISSIKFHIPQIKKIAENTIKNNGYNYPVTIDICKEYFEYREYDGFFLPAGDYDALLINIGNAEGHNWWCALYPAVCLSGATADVKVNLDKVPDELKLADDSKSENIQFEFWIVEEIKKLFS